MSDGALEVIVLNDHAYVNGGTGAVAIASALELASRGTPVTYFACVGPVASELVDVPNLRVICLEQPDIAADRKRRRAMVSGLRNGAAVGALERELARHVPERTIVHVHSWTKALSPFAPAVAARRGFPLVLTLHDFFIACPNGGFFDHGRSELCSRRPLSAACVACACDRRNYGHKLWRVARTVLQNRVLRLPSAVAHFVGVSHFALDRLRPYLPASVPTSVIRNPIEVARRAPVAVAQNRVFVYIGRLEEEKGARLFVAAARRAGVPATVVGDGALAAELRRDFPEVRFTGWLDRAQIDAELAQARMLVFPPLWYETLGLVVIEAAARGVPAIVADQSAAIDAVRDAKNGRHFRHGSVASLADVMRTTAADDAQVERLGRSAHAWFWDDPWTRERHGDELLRLYGALRATRAAPQSTLCRLNHGWTERNTNGVSAGPRAAAR